MKLRAEETSGAVCCRLDLVEHLAGFGEASDAVFAPDLTAVHVYVEHAAAAGNELGLDTKLVFERRRQTGGLGVVASLRAILDADLHSRCSVVQRLGAG
jgi:hypothetical protein